MSQIVKANMLNVMLYMPCSIHTICLLVLSRTQEDKTKITTYAQMGIKELEPIKLLTLYLNCDELETYF